MQKVVQNTGTFCTTFLDFSAPPMATITKYRKKNGELSYQATVRVKQGGKVIFSATRSFPKESLARDWAKRTEVEAAAPDFMAQHAVGKLTVGELLSRYHNELTEADALGRSKSGVISLLLRSSISELRVGELSAGEVVARRVALAARGRRRSSRSSALSGLDSHRSLAASGQ